MEAYDKIQSLNCVVDQIVLINSLRAVMKLSNSFYLCFPCFFINANFHFYLFIELSFLYYVVLTLSIRGWQKKTFIPSWNYDMI